MSRFGGLGKATTFVDAARMVCDEAKRLGVIQCSIWMHRERGPAVLAIDNAIGVSNDYRRYVLSEQFWDNNPVVLGLRAQLRPIGHYEAPDGDMLAVPILGADGWCASIACVLPKGYDVATERPLVMLATYLSVWCTHHGISAIPDGAAYEVLGPRQHKIAELAARGHTNDEIARALAISINTVKSRLKEVFERLQVANRTELANVMRRLAPLQGVPPGITRYKTVTVTRAE